MVREIRKGELKPLLALYAQLHGEVYSDENIRQMAVWQQIMDDRNHHIVVAETDGRIVASCVLVVVPNLTHGIRPYALIENVVTDQQYRRQGWATRCLQFAKEIAMGERCYKIMLMTGSKESGTLGFYEQAGYNRNDKTAFIQWLR